MKNIRNLVAALFILSLPVPALLVLRSIQPDFELHFAQKSKSETSITVVLDGKTQGEYVFDQPLNSGPIVVVVCKQDTDLPVGKIRFADLTWPPGRVIVEIGDEVLDIGVKGGIERRSTEWVSPPSY